MPLRRLWPAALLLLTPAFAACGDDEPDGSDGGLGEEMSTTATASAPESTMDTATATPTPTPTPSPTPSAAPALPAACDVVTAAQVRQIFGVRVGPAEPGDGDTEENGLAWRADECSFEADDVVEITVGITGPDDFTAGAFGCPQPKEIRSIVAPEQDIVGATGGWWKVSDSPPLDAELRACSDEALVVVDVEYEDGVNYDGDPRSQSVALAESVLAALGG